jgi:hypothetical protein
LPIEIGMLGAGPQLNANAKVDPTTHAVITSRIQRLLS